MSMTIAKVLASTLRDVGQRLERYRDELEWDCRVKEGADSLSLLEQVPKQFHLWPARGLRDVVGVGEHLEVPR